LTERELDPKLCPNGILLLTIEGLCVGGGGVQAGVNAPGYVVFIHNDNDGQTDKLKYRMFLKHVLYPFIDEV
jgi:hypothetical protein